MLIPHPLLPEQRDQALEDLKSRLEKALSDQQSTLLANQHLEKEVNELQGLVKEYESGLETITSKFRTHAVNISLEYTCKIIQLIIWIR